MKERLIYDRRVASTKGLEVPSSSSLVVVMGIRDSRVDSRALKGIFE
jgi:hypothetical protein